MTLTELSTDALLRAFEETLAAFHAFLARRATGDHQPGDTTEFKDLNYRRTALRSELRARLDKPAA